MPRTTLIWQFGVNYKQQPLHRYTKSMAMNKKIYFHQVGCHHGVSRLTLSYASSWAKCQNSVDYSIWWKVKWWMYWSKIKSQAVMPYFESKKEIFLTQIFFCNWLVLFKLCFIILNWLNIFTFQTAFCNKNLFKKIFD